MLASAVSQRERHTETERQREMLASAVSQCPPVTGCEKNDVARPTVEYSPSFWGDYFIHLPPSIDQESKSWMEQRLEKLKKEMKRTLTCESDLHIQISIVDAIQRLGLAHHFEEEINKILHQIHNIKMESKDLYYVALRFRLLRQEGYNIASNHEFDMFKDEDGKFMETLNTDVKGLLSFYEAAYLGTHGEVILDEAMKFCKDHLITQLNYVVPKVATQITHSLEIPLYRRDRRLEARHYISTYETLEGRDDRLLELAKLDFNLLLFLHQEEIKNTCVWWKDTGLSTKLKFARDRVVECYFWSLGMYFEPSLSRSRIMMTKVFAFTTLLDDIYDAYGTLEELEIFTEALQRWDVRVLEQLPEYLQIFLITLVKTLKEFEDELAEEGNSYRVAFLQKEISDLAAAYFEEAKWRSEGNIPSFDVHLGISLITATYRMATCAFCTGMNEIATREVFDWVSNFPQMIKASSAIGRLMNDIVSYERERKRDHVASTIQCYMKEHGVSFDDALVELQELMEHAWKDINQESLMPTALPMSLLRLIINLARVSVTFYKEIDGFTYSEGTKDYITLLLIQPIPM